MNSTKKNQFQFYNFMATRVVSSSLCNPIILATGEKAVVADLIEMKIFNWMYHLRGSTFHHSKLV